MIVVADTTPILYLIKIREIDILHLLFKEICIPRAVYNELTKDDKYIDETNILNNTPFVKVYDITDKDLVNNYANVEGIHRGEAEAIALCKQINSKILLIEDIAGIKLAKNEKIITVRIGTILIELNKKGLKTRQEIIDILGKLEKTKIRIGQKIYDYIINNLK
jgi:predicted nucleic acid-binding protein